MTATQNLKIKWLSRAESADHLIHALHTAQKQDQYLLQELEPFEDCSAICQHLEELQRQIKANLISLASVREEIRSCITAVEDMQLQAVLTRRYLAYETTEQIAEAMYYDVRTIQRKHKQALDCITLPMAETSIFQNITCEN